MIPTVDILDSRKGKTKETIKRLVFVRGQGERGMDSETQRTLRAVKLHYAITMMDTCHYMFV